MSALVCIVFDFSLLRVFSQYNCVDIAHDVLA